MSLTQCFLNGKQQSSASMLSELHTSYSTKAPSTAGLGLLARASNLFSNIEPHTERL
jgi:hypothetical protein